MFDCSGTKRGSVFTIVYSVGAKTVSEVLTAAARYSQLIPFVHYIPVSQQDLETDLPAKLAWARAHDAECARIAANAQQLAPPPQPAAEERD